MSKKKIKKKQKKSSSTVIGKNFNVGNRAAEADRKFLLDCFVETDSYNEIIEPGNSRSVLLGRTGAGKSAIIEYVKATQQSVYEFDVSGMAFNYIANNNYVIALEREGVDLSLFYQILWKHVICLELIQQRWNIKREEDQSRILSLLQDWISRDPRKRPAIDYFMEWQGKFWITADQNIKEMVIKLENSLKASAGVKFPIVNAAGEFSDKAAAEMKVELTRLGRDLVSGLQVARLNEIIDLLSTYGFSSENEERPHFLVIDRLDEGWVDDLIRFKLIRALLQTVQTFQRIRGLKVIIAIRADVLFKAYNNVADPTIQREKIRDYVTEIKWTDQQFEELLDRRVERLFRGKRPNSKFYDIFPNSIGNENTLQFILQRSLLRPRDVIEYVNDCLALAEGSEKVTASDVRRAEHQYSTSRKSAILDEWQILYPSLWVYLDFLSGRSGALSMGDVATQEHMGWLAELILDATIPKDDPILSLAKSARESNSQAAYLALARELVGTLYRIGGVRVKLSAAEPWVSCAEGVADISPAALTINARFAIHPMLSAALGAGSHGMGS
jgi:hypothetical protein